MYTPEEIEAHAERLYHHSANAQGFYNHPAWSHLAEETRENWRDFARNKLERGVPNSSEESQ